MVVALVTVVVIAVLAVLGGGYALSWPLWRPVDPLFERLAVAAPRPLPPERLQRRILREAMGRVAVGVNGGIMAPSSFEVRLSPDDLEGLGGLGDWFAGELAGAVAEQVLARGGTVRRPPTVTIVEDDARPRSRPLVSARFESPTEVVGPWDAEGATVAESAEPTVAAGGWELVPTDPGTTERPIRLTGTELIVGRSRSVDVALSDATVSSRHARLQRLPHGRWQITDLGSTNGTHLGGVRLASPAVLDAGDELRIGSVTWRVERR
ncbi:MAG TPA: FhaA domain-containing protein [Acidimicrobiales bacterium]|nr:FhaA domain-containing protein [Acidimicrobiales bacterium]